MMKLGELLERAVRAGASDMHLTAGHFPLMRLHGKVQNIADEKLSNGFLSDLLMNILTDEQRAHLHEEKELDFAYEIDALSRFRVNIFFQMRGLGAAFRTIPTQILSLRELDMPESLYVLSREKKGLVLVTGPTGSGKSTTLAAMIDLINTERADHILTIEDPIEYTHRPKQSLVNQRELGAHTRSFSNALRSALREDPDVILVGEMRDLETISLAITAAETGHLVFATLHTKSAAETVDRVIDVFPSDQQGQIRTMLSNTLQGVVAQRLLPRADQPGRVAAVEVMVATPAIRNLIRENKTHQIHSAIQTGKREGMQTMDSVLADLYQAGRILKEEALREAHDKNLFK